MRPTQFLHSIGILSGVSLWLVAVQQVVIGADPPARLAIQQQAGNVTISWNEGSLETATAVLGPWTPSVATSPLTEPASGHSKFYRTKDQNSGLLSANAVGYVNAALKPGGNLVQNPLVRADESTIATVLASVPDGTVVLKMSHDVWFTALKAYGMWEPYGAGEMTALPGEGLFVVLPGVFSGWTVTFAGEVAQGTWVRTLPGGLASVGSCIPESGKLATDLQYPVSDGDTIYTYDPATGYSIYCYDLVVGGWYPYEPTIPVGGAFLSRKCSYTDWRRTFHVQ